MRSRQKFGAVEGSASKNRERRVPAAAIRWPAEDAEKKSKTRKDEQKRRMGGEWRRGVVRTRPGKPKRRSCPTQSERTAIELGVEDYG